MIKNVGCRNRETKCKTEKALTEIYAKSDVKMKTF